MLREHTATLRGNPVLCLPRDQVNVADHGRVLDPATTRMTPRVQSRAFGVLPGGARVDAWLLTGRGGLTLECLNYGGIVSRLLVPDSDGSLTDVVLGFDELEPYRTGNTPFGAIVGRVAGQIPGSQYRLNGVTYSPVGNQSGNRAGAECGFDKRIWRSAVVNRPDGAPSLKLSLTSPHLDQGHPGNLEVSVTYTITDDNGLFIETEASTDQLTPFSLTHHSCFNLAGESCGSIDDHELQIFSDECVSTDTQMSSMSTIEGLTRPGNDFRRLTSLADSIPHLDGGHGDLYRLRMSSNSEERGLMRAARLVHRASGRILEVSTSARCLQLDAAPELNEPSYGKSGTLYGRHSGVCLDCQGYPGGVNQPELGNILLRPGQTRRETTAYVFSSIAH
jgi:aldose 1-epimerase